MALKCYIIAGEASGDLHGSNLMRAMLEEDPSLEFRFWGGDRMLEQSPRGLVRHIRELAFMGFVEVLMNLRTILGNMRFCKEDILAFKPDALILIDYPGFNMRIAEWASGQGIPVYYYISPQVWAWKQSRVHKIKRFVTKMYVILPFEEAFYARFKYPVEYVGHPLLDEILRFREGDKAITFRERNALDERPLLAVLPGSRRQEVSTKLPLMLKAVENIDTHQIIIGGAPTLPAEFYQELAPGIRIVFGDTYALLANAHTAVVTSGTATLETALFKVPEVVCYKGSRISYLIARQLVKVKFISLVNLIMDREVVRELIQQECTPENIRQEVDRLINDSVYRDAMKSSFDQLEGVLGGGGASRKVAQSLLKTIRRA